MERIQTRALVEGAIFAGITTLLGIAYYYSQYLGIIAMVWPVPVIIVAYRNGIKSSVLSAIAAGFLVSLLTHPFIGLGLLVGFGLPGIMMGYMIGRKMTPGAVILSCGLVLSVTMVAELVLSLKTSGIGLIQFLDSISSGYKLAFDSAINIYRTMGIAEKDLQTMGDFFKQALDMTRLIFPSALVIMGLLFATIDYKLTRLILKRIGHVIPDIEEFSKWRLREPFSLILLGFAVIAGVVSYFKLTQLTAIAVNISTILMYAFFIVGLSVITYYSKFFGDRQGVPKALRNAILVFAVIVFFRVIPFVGILDLVLDFRKLESENRFGGENRDAQVFQHMGT